MLSSLPLPHFIPSQQGHSKIQLKQEVALVEDIVRPSSRSSDIEARMSALGHEAKNSM
jgi:hypothetical protein